MGMTGLGFKGNSRGQDGGSERLPHQLELASAAEGFPDPGVSPECAQGWHIKLEGGRLHRQPCFVLEGHQKHPVLLVLRVLPGNAKLVPRVHKHPRALEESYNRRFNYALGSQRRPLTLAATLRTLTHHQVCSQCMSPCLSWHQCLDSLDSLEFSTARIL